MKQLLFFLLLSSKLFAGTYYFSATGNDALSGTSTANAWQTIAKLNSATFASGDTILFKRGDSFFGQIIVPRSNLYFDAYGTGALPIITGYLTLSAWTNDGAGVWHTNIPSRAAGLINVSINNKLQRLARWPNFDSSNAGWLTYTAINTTTPSITDNTTSFPFSNYTGAELVIRKQEWIIDRCMITSKTGGTFSYSNPTVYTGKVNYGYFIQNDIRLLDQFGEWNFANGTKDLSVFFGANNPASYTVKASTIDTLFNCGGGASGYTGRSNIVVQNIAFEGANAQAVFGRDIAAGNIAIKNCTFNNNYSCIYFWNSPNITIDGNIITNTLSFGIQAFARTLGTGATVVQNNTVRNCALYNGMSGNGDGQAIGIGTDGDVSTLIQNNIVDSIGYNGINWQGSNVLVKNNLVTNFTMTRDDGGGIYTFHDLTKTNRIVQGNIVIGGIGAPLGRADNAGKSHSIYLDGQTANVQVLDNTISQTFGNGILCNNGVNINIRRNTFYNVPVGIQLSRFPGTSGSPSNLLRNDTIFQNIIYPTTSNLFYWNGQLNEPSVVSIQADMQAIGRYDSNYVRNDLAAPFDYFYHLTAGGTFVDPAPLSFAAWKTFIADENNSQALPTTANVFQYNASAAAVAYNFPGYTKTDARGNIYTGTATIPAWGSLILFDAGITTGGRNYFIKRRHR